MNFLTKVKNDVRMMLGFSIGGAALMGVGLTGMITAPSYHHIIAGLDQSWSSEAEAFKWIEENINQEDTPMYEVSFGHFIPQDEIDDYITAKYSDEFDAKAWFTSGTYTVDENGLLTTTVTLSRDLETVYKNATGAGEFDIDAATATWIENETKFGSEFATSYASQFDTRAEAEADWLYEKTERHTFNSRTEYQGVTNWFTSSNDAKDDIANNHTIGTQDQYRFNGGTWSTVETNARNAAITAEEHNVSTIAAIPATPNTEADYKLAPEYATERDAWIAANTTPEDNTDPDNIIPEYVPTEAEYLASVGYITNRDNWLASSPDKGDAVAERYSYKGTTYDTRVEATAAVEAFIDTTADTRTMYTHDGTNFDFTSEANARTAYRNTLTPNERTMWAHDGSNFDYDSQDRAQEAYVLTIDEAAAVSEYSWFRASGVDVNTWSTDKTSVESQVANNMDSKDAIDGEVVTSYDDYNLTELFLYEGYTSIVYNSLANLIAAYKLVEWADLEDMLVTVETFSLEGNDHWFSTREEAVAFWKSLVTEVKK